MNIKQKVEVKVIDILSNEEYIFVTDNIANIYSGKQKAMIDAIFYDTIQKYGIDGLYFEIIKFYYEQENKQQKEQTNIERSQYEKYINNNINQLRRNKAYKKYIKGNFVQVTNGNENKFINKSKLQYYLKRGYHIGLYQDEV